MSSSESLLPPRDATPSTIRAYFARVLHEHHNVQKEKAENIAAKWQYGRGSELTYYDIETFRSIFGGEAGALLFGYARRELRTSRTSPSSQIGRVEMPEKDIFGMTPGCKLPAL
ncbi:hypothetical protein D0Z07_0772 [Hyphodiscus hymeniophilus]|uniref:Uncharacterized protein n=1 Tax=Hyphodiscus hymeniophilus TaxID=353542 RepID=A0A9P6VR80_9HELO|nr:hypothetical protein D0Z07_0772 [Hyphodiscus hymeniophilus]